MVGRCHFLGNAFAPIALAFAVLDLTGFGRRPRASCCAARSLPTVALLLVGGVWADRMPRHVLLVVFSLIAAITQSAAAALLITRTAHVWQLALLEAVNGVSAAFLAPASMGAVPQTVAPALIQQANALLRLCTNVAKMLGAGLAGLVVAAYGAGWAIAFDAATFLVAGVFFAGLRLPSGGAVRAGMLRELAGGWREFRSRKWLWAIVVQFAFVNAAFSGGFEVLGPVVAVRSLGGPRCGGSSWRSRWSGSSRAVCSRSGTGRGIRCWSAMYGVLIEVPMLIALAVAAPLPVIIAAAFVAGRAWRRSACSGTPPCSTTCRRRRCHGCTPTTRSARSIFSPAGQSLAGPATVAFGLGGAVAAQRG